MSRTTIIHGQHRHLNGWKKEKADHRDLKLAAPGPMLPTHVDLRAMCPDIHDQGAFGSCTANAGCETMEFLERKGKGSDHFSRFFLYFYTRMLEGTPADEDSGAEIRSVMKSLSKFGVPHEATWPYIDENFSKTPSVPAIQEAEHHKALFYYKCSSLFTVKASLAQGYPVTFGFTVPNNMMDEEVARTGLVKYPTPTEGFCGGHAVLAVGYDDSMTVGKEVGAILCQNSWGKDWGLSGFFWLPYKFWADGLADDNWTLRKAQV